MQISILTSTSKRFPTKRQKKFGLMSEVDKMKIFPKETFLLEILLWARKRLFGHSCPKRFDKVWYFTVQCPTMIKKHCFFKKNVFFLSFFCRYAECSFDQSIEKILKNASEFFPQNRVKRKKFRFSILFSKQLSIHVECSFNNPVDQNFHSWPKICRSIFEEALKNPREKLLLRNFLWTLRLHIWKPCWKSLPEGW